MIGSSLRCNGLVVKPVARSYFVRQTYHDEKRALLKSDAIGIPYGLTYDVFQLELLMQIPRRSKAVGRVLSSTERHSVTKVRSVSE
jgi:hypothetical protein